MMRVMTPRWKRYSLMLVVAILTVTSVAALVHRHVGSADELGCVLCHVRHEQGIGGPVATVLAPPVTEEWKLEIAAIQPYAHESIPVRSGRAPPASLLAS